MFRKLIYIISLILLVLVVAMFYKRLSADPVSESKDHNVLKVVPSDAALILLSDNSLNFTNALLHQNLVWKTLKENILFGTIDVQLNELDSILQSSTELKAQLNETPVVISYHKIGQSDFCPLIAVQLNNKLTSNDLVAILKQDEQYTFESRLYDDTKLYSSENKGKYSGYYVRDNYFVWSSSQLLLEKSSREYSRDAGIVSNSDFYRVLATRGNNAPATLFIGSAGLAETMSLVSDINLKDRIIDLAGSNSWMATDIGFKSNALSFLGFMNYSEVSILKTFNEQTPGSCGILNMVPAGTQQLVGIKYSDLSLQQSTYIKVLGSLGRLGEHDLWQQKFENKTGISPLQFMSDHLTGELVKVAYGGMSDGQTDKYILAGVKSKSLCEKELNNILSSYAEAANLKLRKLISDVKIDKNFEITVFEVPFADYFTRMFGDFVNSDSHKYWALYDNMIIAAENENVISRIVLANELGKTLTRQSYYQDFAQYMTDEYNLMFYQDSRSLAETMNPIFNDVFFTNLIGDENLFHNLNGIGFQLISSEKLPYVNAVIDYSGKQIQEAETLWQSLLDTASIMKPALVENHYTKEKEIFIQDLKHNIYLLSPSGRILWKKHLDGPLLGEVQQIDRYKNGKLQLLFNTGQKLYLVDRNGNNVENFPVKLPSEAVVGLGLADYEKNRDYRIFIPTADRRILLYNAEGNRVKGWRFDKTDHPAIVPVQHLRVDSKDYSLTADRNRIYILNRQGQERIKLDNQFKINNNGRFYLEREGPGGSPAILTLDDDNNFVTILFSGKVLRDKLPQNIKARAFEIDDFKEGGGLELAVVDSSSVLLLDRKQKVLFSSEVGVELKPYLNIYRFSNNDLRLGVSGINNKIYMIDKDGNIRNGFQLIGSTPF